MGQTGGGGHLEDLVQLAGVKTQTASPMTPAWMFERIGRAGDEGRRVVRVAASAVPPGAAIADAESRLPPMRPRLPFTEPMLPLLSGLLDRGEVRTVRRSDRQHPPVARRQKRWRTRRRLGRAAKLPRTAPETTGPVYSKLGPSRGKRGECRGEAA